MDPEQRPLPPDQKKRRTRSGRNSSDGGFDMRTEVYKRLGVDVLQIPGLERTALSLLTKVLDWAGFQQQLISSPGLVCAPTTT